jgi:AbrB family looped-hinge helix DNA binding protein
MVARAPIHGLRVPQVRTPRLQMPGGRVRLSYMKTRLSSKGQVVLPAEARRILGLEAGETLEVTIEDNRVVLTPATKRTNPVRLGISPVTGLPVLIADKSAGKLTSAQVKEILADFP